MKIIELKSENIKRVKAVEIKPKDNVVIISGKNDQGKSSILDSIWYALEGKGSLKDTPMPIRKGENKAEVKLTLDDFVVTRNWTANDKSYLKVTNREGLAYSSPQELLDSFIGKLAFDPLVFAGMKEKEQRDLLLDVAGINFSKIDYDISALKEERTMKGREVKLMSGEREIISTSDLPEKEIDISKLNNQYQEALNANYEIKNKGDKIEEFKSYIINCDQDIKEYELKIEDLKKNKEKMIVAIDNLTKWLKENKMVETELLKDKITNAYEINDQIKARQRNDIKDIELSKKQAEYDKYTKDINSLLAKKEEILKSAKMPISGINIDDNGVLFKEIPFAQLSSSEQLKVSLSIAIALNPKLKVIRIVDGSLLDEDNMALIKCIAKEKDYQIWIERVNDTGELCFIIEDGELVDKKG